MKTQRKMERREFYSLVGISATAVILSCLGCSKSSGSSSGGSTTGPSGIDFMLDLNAAANSVLLKNGGYMVSNGLIVARTTSGAYIAVQQSCTHENYPLTYQATSQRFYCNNHGATFSEKGAVTGGPTSRSLTVYNTQLTGTTLRIYS